MENQIIKNRLSKFRDRLREKNLDGALIVKRENYIYLSGFTGTSAFLVITDDKAFLLTDFRYVEQAGKQAPEYEIVKYQGNVLAAVNELIVSNSIKRLAFEENFMTFDSYREFDEKLEISEFLPLEGAVEALRIVKDAWEIETIKKAVSVADGAFSHVLNHIKPGVAEVEIAAEIEYFMKKQGARGPSFETIVASGERAAMPHGVASERKLQMGDAITLDFGALYMDYCSDMTRTVFLGQPAEELKKIYNIVLEAQLMGIEGAKAGMTGKQIDAIAREHIAGKGYGDHFGHGLGHGVGLEIHEEPRLSLMGGTVLQDGMAVTVEPGIYLSGLGGVRIEDIIIINGGSPSVLTSSTKEMIIL